MHDEAQPVLGDLLVENGVIVGGEGVVVAAVARDRLRVAVARQRPRVPRNIMCSKKCASPEMPGGSSTAPTLNQSISVTTGARRSGTTTTCRPFCSTNWKTLAGWAGTARASAAAKSSAQTAIPDNVHDKLFTMPSCLDAGS
jgi:hypothetical protein